VPTWPHHIAVYGPPGAGKTSLVQAATAHGYSARDLEEDGRTYAERAAALAGLPETAPCTLFGAADATPEDFPAGTRFVLLAPSPDELVRRVKGRGDQRNHKWVEHALQVRREHLVMADEGVFDLVIAVDGPPAVVLDIIVARFPEPAR